MFLHPSYLRFIIIRSCIISFIIIIFLQILANFNTNHIPLKKLNRIEKIEQKLQEKLFDEGRILYDVERVQRIKLTNNQLLKEEVNWKRVFLESYEKKSVILNRRDSKTIYKNRTRDDDESLLQLTIEIFEETTVFDNPKFCSSPRVFHPHCPYSNCQWTCRTTPTNTANARRGSVFHHADIKHDEMRAKLERRIYDDIWILWIDEANREIEDLNQYQFNWTLSFRQDSEVSIGSYGMLIQRNERTKSSYNNSDFLQILSDANIQVSDPFLENRILTSYRFRHKHALWFVSNCMPKRRLKYYEELKQHYPVKAFGSCVKKKCDRTDGCEFDQSHLAMFYLAFESQTCTDYITEKFWRALYYGMIPIVLGPAKQSYLDLGVPESAFIHIDDFKSVKALAHHLHRIANNYLYYRKYFQWLNQYEVFYDINELEPIRMCELCMRLNMQDLREHSFYNKIQKWHRAGC